MRPLLGQVLLGVVVSLGVVTGSAPLAKKEPGPAKPFPAELVASRPLVAKPPGLPGHPKQRIQRPSKMINTPWVRLRLITFGRLT
jgi:hypothetical protein